VQLYIDKQKNNDSIMQTYCRSSLKRQMCHYSAEVSSVLIQFHCKNHPLFNELCKLYCSSYKI